MGTEIQRLYCPKSHTAFDLLSWSLNPEPSSFGVPQCLLGVTLEGATQSTSDDLETEEVVVLFTSSSLPKAIPCDVGDSDFMRKTFCIQMSWPSRKVNPSRFIASA